MRRGKAASCQDRSRVKAVQQPEGAAVVQDRKSLRARAARTNHSTFAADKDSRHAGSGLLKRAPLPSAAVPREATIPSRPPAKLNEAKLLA